MLHPCRACFEHRDGRQLPALDVLQKRTAAGGDVRHLVGDPELVEAADKALLANADDWLVREISHYLKRTLKRVDVSSRSLIALVEQGSCFAGTLLELVLAADRSFMLTGVMEGSNLPAASLRLTVADIQRYGPGIIADYSAERHVRVLVWVE